MRRMQIRVILGMVCLMVVVLGVGCDSGSSQPSQAPPQSTDIGGVPTVDSATVLNVACSQCHSVDAVTSRRRTRGQWTQTVDRMIGWGAQLTDAQKVALIDYLAANYGS